MNPVPRWLEDIIGAFASGMGLSNFALNEKGVAALAFENGVALRLEYALDALTLALYAQAPLGPSGAKALLSCADPLRRGAFRMRAGLLEHPSRAVVAVRMEAADITLGNLEGAMAELWRAVENYRRRLGA